MSNKMRNQVPSIEMFEALAATVNNLSAQLAYTNKELSALRNKDNTKHEVYETAIGRLQSDMTATKSVANTANNGVIHLADKSYGQ